MRLAALACVLPLCALAAPKRVAIAYFDNDTGDAQYDPLRKGLADMLITDLSQVESLSVVERDKLEAVLGELKLQRSKFFDPKSAQKFGKGLGAELILTGSMLVDAKTMKVNARLIEVGSGKVVVARAVDGKKEEFFAIEKELVEALTSALELKLGLAEKSKLRKSQTESFDAFAHYSQGLAAKDAGDEAKAREEFLAAVDADPEYRAAKSAAERVKVLVKKGEALADAQFEKTLASLDPKAPDFEAKVSAIFQANPSAEAPDIGRRIALLTWMVERDARCDCEPRAHFDYAWGYVDDPEIAELYASVAEYEAKKYPGNSYAKTYANLIPRAQETVAKKKRNAAEAAQWWKMMSEAMNEGTLAQRENVHRLWKLMAKKARK